MKQTYLISAVSFCTTIFCISNSTLVVAGQKDTNTVQTNKITTSKKVVKRYITKGRNKAQLMEEKKPVNRIVKKVVKNKSETPSALPEPSIFTPLITPELTGDLISVSDLNAETPESVSPLGQWFNQGFGWVDSLLGNKSVKPWQKSTLAEPAMAAGGIAPVLGKFANKVFISKEATLGGNGVAGGGCGCK
ncbi:hypothetical protein CJF42_20625 [Pseudoalteromonas sp. NBT06-2]|uniref:DUF4266 domain-containing protein n=1 Tax=Pseudoalteromonas sp. NBT06-2 TaxID=2025950 RepID=UPI000BA55C0F|nr:DUF4266 domain-containing protein [Pseudoalteromonas sp. NBT06-2]PAJ72560.1 hypothetical protein CJF42_20625 [Pseudoalteromonas sp. NBT06-2]